LKLALAVRQFGSGRDRLGRLIHLMVALVPVSITPRRADRQPAPELLHFADVSLRTHQPRPDRRQTIGSVTVEI
jgi:hypothetical protein